MSVINMVCFILEEFWKVRNVILVDLINGEYFNFFL